MKYGDATIELLEEREYKNKDEMLLRERHFIENNKCVNKQKPLLKDDERDYYDIYRCECECGGSYVNKHKARHNRTKKHMNHERGININITINMTINESEVKIINGSDVR